MKNNRGKKVFGMMMAMALITQMFSMNIALAGEGATQYDFNVYYSEDIYSGIRDIDGNTISVGVDTFILPEGFMGDYQEFMTQYAGLLEEPVLPWNYSGRL